MDEKKSVLIFSTAYLPFLGGAELAIKEITDRLHDLHFILITARMRCSLLPKEHMGNIEVYRVGIGVPIFDKILSPFLAAWYVFKITRHSPVCLFWSVMVSYTTITPVLLKMFGLYKNMPLLLTLQEGDSKAHITRARLGLVGFWWRFALQQADHVQVISAYLEKLAREFGYAGIVSVVPNGADIHKFTPSFDRVPRRMTGQISDDATPVIITVSRLVEKNGVDVLIKAFAEVCKKFPDVALHIVGDGKLRGELEALVNMLGIGNKTVFLGEVPHEKISACQSDAYMFVRPSRSEGLGTAFLEAMADGLPVIGTPVGGIVDFLKDGETGLFCKVDDPKSLAEKILLLLQDKELHKRLQDNGRRLVGEKYDWDGITLQMKTIFQSLCAS
ncbi:MAG: hypothetical protein G01um101429_416 [Parcubacteria group bacterium Gr01-1014_29]|nr:MAG: hypothetical protein G01um101429_416 [Parcubacteria group bacterium Gr01-1014_29]